ncbi:MAG: hypothetical protein ACI9AT_001218 [Ulvibacter sp.]|jgi:hypothetical protein
MVSEALFCYKIRLFPTFTTFFPITTTLDFNDLPYLYVNKKIDFNKIDLFQDTELSDGLNQVDLGLSDLPNGIYFRQSKNQQSHDL